MLTRLSTVKSRFAIADASYDDLLTSAIKAVSDRFDRQCNRTFARAVDATEEFQAEDTETCPQAIQSKPSRNSKPSPPKPKAGSSKPRRTTSSGATAASPWRPL